MLENVRVIDLTMHLSGPYCCWLLASLGADVIKVERPDGGDPVRETGPFVAGESIYFGSVNRGKRSVVIDLKSEEGKHAFAELLKTADVLVENFRSGVLARLGFDDGRLKELNPRLVHTSITGFGQKGTLAKRPAFDIVIQGMSGMMSVTGPVDGDATAVGMSIADVTTGVFAALSVLAGLYEREQTKSGSRADIAMLDCQLALLENASARFLNAGEIATRVGSRHPKIVPFQSFAARDRSIVVAADGERNWQSMCKALGIGELLNDRRFSDNTARVVHAAELEELLKPVFASRNADELLDLLAQHDVPCGPVNSIPEVLEMSHVTERSLISEVEREDGQRFKFIASPIAHGMGRKETAAPALGQHTLEVMRELGLKP
ncbi:hypothetical protein A9R05_21745 [Burkholderia sp. KK1]|nr:hypothetical protein A9R05_21745 [Burkholderia sp. KK1]